MIGLIDRIVVHFAKKYNTLVFRVKTGCKSKQITIDRNVQISNTNIICGNNVHIYKDVVFLGNGPIVIGDNVEIGNQTIIYASQEAGIYIGDNVSIAGQCYIIDSDHGIKRDELIRKQPPISSKVVIEEDVWVAAGCKILKGSHLKKGSVLGAQSLCKGEIDEYGVAIGCPAKVLKYRV